MSTHVRSTISVAQVSLAEDNHSVAVGAGVGASVAVVVIIVIVSILIVMRRRYVIIR